MAARAPVHDTWLQLPSTEGWDIGIYQWDWFVLVGITASDGWQWETPEFQATWNSPLSGPGRGAKVGGWEPSRKCSSEKHPWSTQGPTLTL